MDLSKAYDCIPHDILLAPFEAYGFGLERLNLMNSHLTNRLQRVKVKSCVPQGSVFYPLLFNSKMQKFATSPMIILSTHLMIV